MDSYVRKIYYSSEQTDQRIHWEHYRSCSPRSMYRFIVGIADYFDKVVFQSMVKFVIGTDLVV